MSAEVHCDRLRELGVPVGQGFTPTTNGLVTELVTRLPGTGVMVGRCASSVIHLNCRSETEGIARDHGWQPHNSHRQL